MAEYVVSGLAEKLGSNGSWKDYNTTGPPKVTVNVNLEGSGLIEVKNPLATIEELYWVNVTREKKADSNASDDSNGTNASSEESGDAEKAASEESVNKSD